MERVDANLEPFAQNNLSGYRFAFGTDTATDDINTNYNDNIKKGWGTTPNEFPEVEDFNAMAYTTGYLLSYLYQMGIAEWNDKQEYREHSRVIGSNGIVYKAKTGTDISPNVDNDPTTDTTNWEIDNQFNINGLTDKVTLADTDNFAIQETGGLFKKVSWANLKFTLKTYFDTLYVTLSGDQSIDGFKKFVKKISTPNVSYKDIAETITSWSYSGTTITLNVASHTFIVGDHIKVSGLSATTYPANGIHLITNVTPTTIVFTSATPPTGTTGVSSATVKGYATVNGRVSGSIGINQVWKDVTANRLAGVTYYNTTGEPIAVSIALRAGASSTYAQFVSNGQILRFGNDNQSGGIYGSLFSIVPDNGAYMLNFTSSPTIINWSELSE